MVSAIYRGINLGNSLDAVGGETAWHNPLTTQRMIQAIAERGFDTLRLPVTWTAHIGAAPDWLVDEAWIKRVRQVVMWALDAGLRVILNTHHDNDFFYPSFSVLPLGLARLMALWQQISACFADVGDRLLFEGLNEPRPAGTVAEWTGGTAESRQCLNAMQHAFIQTVRKSGGLNADRPLLVTTCAAAITDDAFSGFILPDDPNLMLSLHTYDPRNFCFNNAWESPTAVFGEAEAAALDELFTRLARITAHLNVPAVITEFGAVTKLDENGCHNDDEVAIYTRYFTQKAQAMGVGCIWWDNNYYESGDEWFGLMDRATLTWHLPKTVDALLQPPTGNV